MAKYIDAEALINELQSHGAICDFGVFLIERQPAADVRPERHGWWETSCDGHLCCSVCNEYVYCSEDEAPIDKITNFCPNCGAKMEGERL